VKKFCLGCVLVFAAAGVLHTLSSRLGLRALHAQQPAATDWSAGPAPNWVWGADNDKKYKLTTTFTGPTKAARLRAACDNVMTITLNGTKIGESNDWQAPVDIDLQKHVKDGTNELVFDIANEGGAAGFLGKVALTRADGKVDYLVTDESWKATNPNGKNATPVRVIAKHGAGPWGNVLTAKAAASAMNEPAKFNLLPGFEVEKLYTVPKDELGSWVCIAPDDKGRLIVSDQGDKGLCRITPPAIGSKDEPKIERLKVKMSSVQGMLHAFGGLYCSVNGGQGSGLYRLRDTDGDDQYDEVVKLKEFRGGGEHGPHALRLSPDGKSIYVIAGNHTKPPFDPLTNASPQTMGGIRAEQLTAKLPENSASRISPNWDEDLVLPRQWDAGGHAVGILAPGGWIAKTDPEAKSWEVVSMGYRNPYDMAFNADGELFAYDADMEWDFGAPWYRPTRVVHAVSGSEFGWRSGTGKWPTYYADSLPPVIDIGPGSPVGVEFGYGTKFPAKYQKALYICDWTFGTMYAIHLEPKGSTYTATKEEFVSRTPLPLTDCTVGKDGALYFTVGGRNTQSELYRVTYTGKESTEPVDAKDLALKSKREQRHLLEAGHVAADKPPHKSKITFLVQDLANPDRNLRYAARVALERLPIDLWKDMVYSDENPLVTIHGVLGLARVGDVGQKPHLLARLERVDYSKLSEEQKLDYLRALQLVCIRLGLPDDAARTAINNKLEAVFPSSSDRENRELVNVLVALKSPNIVAKTIPLLSVDSKTKSALQASEELLARNRGYGGTIANTLAKLPDAQQMDYAFALRNAKEGWTPETRKLYFEWFGKARGWSGGNSFGKFLTNIDKDAFANAPPEDQQKIDALGIRKPFVATNLPKAKGPGKDYTLDDLIALEPKLTGRNFKTGSQMFQAARCVICHRFGGDGGSTGPDLTQLAGRFNLKDLSEAIVDPSKVVSDQYRAMVVETKDGKTYTGRIVGDNGKSIKIATDPEDGSKLVDVAKADIESEQASPTSLMPKDLLKPLNQNEVLDLLAYLLSRGDPNHQMFKK
jgi:putative heme-binding domain-containing protein